MMLVATVLFANSHFFSRSTQCFLLSWITFYQHHRLRVNQKIITLYAKGQARCVYVCTDNTLMNYLLFLLRVSELKAAEGEGFRCEQLLHLKTVMS